MTEVVRLALEEDIGSGDVTTGACVPAWRRARGRFLARETLVVAGLDLLREVYDLRGGVDELTLLRRDGECARDGECIAMVSGSAHTLLECERVALNFLQHLSGVATAARRFADAAAENLRQALSKWLAELAGLSGPQLVEQRYQKFRNMGNFFV